MSFTHTISRNFSRPGESLSSSIATTADAEDCRDITIATPATSYEIDITIAVAKLKSLYILSDQALTLHVNTSGGQTFALIANEPSQWTSTDGGTSPLGSTDVTKILVDNASGVAANLQIRVLQDSTPT